MSIIGKIIGKMDVSNLRFKKPSKSEHKPSLLKEVWIILRNSNWRLRLREKKLL